MLPTSLAPLVGAAPTGGTVTMNALKLEALVITWSCIILVNVSAYTDHPHASAFWFVMGLIALFRYITTS